MSTEQNKAQHTPTPWRYAPPRLFDMGLARIITPDALVEIARCAPPDAEHIVRAVNSHAALVEALEAAVDVLAYLNCDPSENVGIATVEAELRGRAALAAVKKEA